MVFEITGRKLRRVSEVRTFAEAQICLNSNSDEIFSSILVTCKLQLVFETYIECSARVNDKIEV